MQTNRVESRQRILEAARKLFAHHGYAGTSVQEIAKLAKVTKPTLYYYFGSKAGLFQALVDCAYDSRMVLMQQAVEGHHKLKDQLIRILEALLQFAQDHRDLMRICFITAFAAPGEIPHEIRFFEKGARNFEFVHSLIKKGLASHQLDSHFKSRELAGAIYGQFVIYAMGQVIQHPHFRAKPVSKRIVQLFLEGAKKKSR